jgi:replicative DNA helicase
MYYSEEAEQSIIGCLLLEGSAAAELLLNISADDFFFDNHKRIFEFAQANLNAGRPVDALTVFNGLNRTIDMAYLIELVESNTSVSNGIHYCDIVQGHAKKRALSDMAYSILEQLRESEVDSVKDYALSSMTKIQTGKDKKKYSIRDGLKELLAAMKHRFHSGEMVGIPTGFSKMDFAWDGLHREALYTVGGTPGTGKTSIIMNMVEYQAQNAIVEKYGKPVVFSQEMGQKSLAMRLAAKRSNIGMSKLRKANLNDDEWSRFMTGYTELLDLSDNMIIDCTPSVTPSYIKTKLHEIELQEGKIGAVYIDYFTLMKMQKNVSKDQGTSDNANDIDALKKQFDCPVIVLTQLNKDVSKMKKKPNEGDVDWGKQLTQNANCMIMLYATEDMREKGYVHLYTPKVRDMEPIDQMMKFDGSTSDFKEAIDGDYVEPEQTGFKGYKPNKG